MKQYSYVRNGCEAIDLRLLSAANFNRKEQNELQCEGEREGEGERKSVPSDARSALNLKREREREREFSPLASFSGER